jgi:hypothetical protein
MATVTRPDPDGVEPFLAALGGRRRAEADLLIGMLRRVTGHPPSLWGPSMIGFDEYHYRYASGHEGHTFKVGFSPRKAKLSLYGIGRSEAHLARLSRLGTHTLAVGCVYVNKLADIDLAVLEELFDFSYRGYDAPR